MAIYSGSPITVLTYARPDWLGSSRLVTNTTQQMVSDSAYAPFGEQYAVSGSSPLYDFTGQEQWTVFGTGNNAALDDFLFRKYHPVQGRWISADPAGLDAVDIADPQSWNRYAYVMNNPLTFVDYLGLKCSQNPVTGQIVCDVLGTLDTTNTGVSSGNQGNGGGSNGSLGSGGGRCGRACVERVLRALKSWVPSVCSGGGFGYGAANVPVAPEVSIESIGLVEYDTKEGGSHGGVLGLEVGPTVTGVESIRTWNDWQAHTGPIFISGREFSAAGSKFGKNIKPGTFDGGGFANWMNGQLSVGGYFGGKVFGGGGYVSLSWSGCKS